MKITRRKKVGKVLLTVSMGCSVSVLGCTDNKDTLAGEKPSVVVPDSGVTGNLMAPPVVDFCIDVTPDEAEVTIEEQAVTDGQCVDVYEGNSVEVRAQAEGYDDFEEIVRVNESMVYPIELIPVENK